jgi:hypothetical protein
MQTLKKLRVEVAFPEDGVNERRHASDYSQNVTLCRKYGELSVGLMMV